MLNPKKIAMQIELCADEIFNKQHKKRTEHFKDWQVSSDFVSTLFQLLDLHYRTNLPDKANAFVQRYSQYAGQSIWEIGVEQADVIREEFEALIE